MDGEKPLSGGVGAGAAIVIGSIFGLLTLITAAFNPQHSWAPAVLGVLTIVMIVACLALDIATYPDRLEQGIHPFRRRVVRFAQCRDATLAPDGGGRPRLRFVDATGKRWTFSISSGSRNEHQLEEHIRLLVALLERNGVPVDSRNVAGNGPYSAWRVPEPRLDLPVAGAPAPSADPHGPST